MAVTITYDALVTMLYHGPGTEDRPDLVRNIFNAAVASGLDCRPPCGGAD